MHVLTNFHLSLFFVRSDASKELKKIVFSRLTCVNAAWKAIHKGRRDISDILLNEASMKIFYEICERLEDKALLYKLRMAIMKMILTVSLRSPSEAVQILVTIYNSGCDALKALALALLQQIVTLNPISATDAAKNLPGILAAATLATKEGIMNTKIGHLLVCLQLVLNDTHNRIQKDHEKMLHPMVLRARSSLSVRSERWVPSSI